MFISENKSFNGPAYKWQNKRSKSINLKQIHTDLVHVINHARTASLSELAY